MCMAGMGRFGCPHAMVPAAVEWRSGSPFGDSITIPETYQNLCERPRFAEACSIGSGASGTMARRPARARGMRRLSGRKATPPRGGRFDGERCPSRPGGGGGSLDRASSGFGLSRYRTSAPCLTCLAVSIAASRARIGLSRDVLHSYRQGCDRIAPGRSWL